MNPQAKYDKAGQLVSRGIEWCDFTWNYIGGCKHQCRWKMPDGTIARCYAEDAANRNRSETFYPQGFEHHYVFPDRLDEPLSLKRPARIFIDSMSDLMGHWVPQEQIEAVLDVCQRARWHTFFLLTKNAPRLARFKFPPNVWVGVSSPPSYMMGQPLSKAQQEAMLHKSLRALADVDVPVRWLSAEPLAMNIAPFLAAANLQWVVIGAASGGLRTYQPDPAHITALLKMCDARRIPIFFKGNLKWLPWREDYPALPEPIKQMEMF